MKLIMKRFKKKSFSASSSVARKGTVEMLCMILIGLFLIVGCKKDNSEKDTEYPIEIPFTEYSLPQTCQWTNLAYDNTVVIINSDEELKQYVACTDGDYPKIDFSKHTLLVASGKTDDGVSKITVVSLQQLSENGYELNMEILLNGTDVLHFWTIALLIVEKTNEESNVKLNITLSDYPINIPFEKYSLFGTSCWWNIYCTFPTDPYIITINNHEELDEYIACYPDGTYPEVDFSKHTLVLAVGAVNYDVYKFTAKNLQQISENEYKFNIEITLRDIKFPGNKWHFAFIVEKLNEESSMELNMTYEYYPITIPFTEYYMHNPSPQGLPPCWDLFYSYSYGHLTIINSDKELKQYLICVEDFPAIDFSKHTLLVANGYSNVGSFFNISFVKNSINQYTLNVTVRRGNIHISDKWIVAILIPKITDEETVILNFQLFF
jgi:hypothetical protein